MNWLLPQGPRHLERTQKTQLYPQKGRLHN